MGISPNHPDVLRAIARGLVREHGRRAEVRAPALPAATARRAELPLPPSTNHLFVTRGRRRFKSPAYRAWLSVAGPLLHPLGRPTVPVDVSVAVVGAVNQSRDLDNLLKPIGDALVSAGVLPGDSVRHVRGWRVWWEPDTRRPAVALVELLTAGGAR